MKTKLVWRLGKLPSPDEVRELVKDKIITQDEARDILFTEDIDGERDKKSLESEIKFLRELVEKLSSSKTKIVEVIKEIYQPYYYQPWYKPYDVWSTVGGIAYTTSGSVSAGSNPSNSIGSITTSSNFSSIKTF